MSERATLFDAGFTQTSEAVLSDDGRHRYRLTRTWQPGLPVMVWVMLNPSIADAIEDDATIRRCKGYARLEGCGGIVVVNLYAYRATSPQDMLAQSLDDAIGPLNDQYVTEELAVAATEGWPVVVGWGVHAEQTRADWLRSRAESMGAPLLCVGVTKSGAPRHPGRGSYVPLQPWPAPLAVVGVVTDQTWKD